MHCSVLFFLFGLIAIGVFCADWDIFQDSGSTSSDNTLALANTGGLDPFITNQDPSTKPDLDDLFTVANQADPNTLFNSGDLYTSFDSLGSSNLLANADDSCSLPPTRRMRARANEGTSCSNIYNNIDNPLSSTMDGVIYEGLQVPRLGRKITDYEDADQRLTGQAYCPMHQTILPTLILPVCDSGIPGFTQNLLAGTLFTVYNGFLSKYYFILYLLLYPSLLPLQSTRENHRSFHLHHHHNQKPTQKKLDPTSLITSHSDARHDRTVQATTRGILLWIL